MKSTVLKSSLFALVIATAFTSCQKKEGYKINGKIAGLDKGMVYLEYADEKGDKKIIDSAEVKEGAFTFTGKTVEPLFHTIKIKGQEYGAYFLLDNEDITDRKSVV